MNNQADQTKLRRLQNRIRARKGLIGCGAQFSVALHYCGKLVYAGTDRWGQEEARTWTGVMSLACGADYIMALLEDGTLRVAGKPPFDPSLIRKVSCGRTFSVGESHLAVLLGNGRIVTLGDNRFGQCNTGSWPSVTDVVCGRTFTAGVTLPGQVFVVGGSRAFRDAVREWRNVAGLFTDEKGNHLYAITDEGRLLSTRRLPRETKKWRELVYVSSNGQAIWAVTTGGALLSTGKDVDLLSDRKQYVACSVGASHVLALTRDGQVLSVGSNDFGQCNTTRFGSLFPNFDELRVARRERSDHMTEQERRYQVALSDTARCRSRLACGKRITVCINAEGRVLTTAEFPTIRSWSQVRAVACGNAHVLGLHDNGTVSADGNNIDGCTDVSSWEKVKAVAARRYHSLGVTEDGQVLFTGRNDCGQGDVFQWTRVNRIAADDRYTVGVTYDGQILLCGDLPFDPSVITEEWRNPVSLVAASTHVACLYADGTVRTTLPTMNTHEWSGVRAIAAGEDLTLGLCYGGHVVAAGGADGISEGFSAWQQVVDIGCGDGYAAALTSDGRVLVVSRHGNGASASYPVVSPNGHRAWDMSEAGRWQGIIALACGPSHLAGLNENGQIQACGADEDGQCSAVNHFVVFRDPRQLYGYGQYGRHLEQEIQAHRAATLPKEESRPNLRETLSPVEAAVAMRGKFAIGMAHTLVLREDGTVSADGANDCGQQDLAAYESAVYVAAGPYRSAAILSDGRIVMSGRNSDGQSDARALNREVDGETGTVGERGSWVQISCGHSHTVALRSDGRVFSVGANPDGRCDTTSWQDVAEVCCGIRHTAARRADGTCLATGDNRYGQCNLEAWRDTVMVAAGEFHTAALCADGRVVAVGDNRKGQCNVEDLTDVVSIACLPESTLCVLADGRVIMRGGSGELNAAVESLRDVVALETCEHRVAVVTATQEMVLIP